MSHAERRSTIGKAGSLSFLDWDATGTGTPILYLHPVNTAAAVWSDVVTELGAPGRALAVDYRAHGQSEAGGSYYPVDYATDALAVLDAALVERAHLVSGSIGGAVAVELAAAAPERVASIAAFGATLRLGWPAAVLDETEAALHALGIREWFTRHGDEILGPARRPEAAGQLIELASTGRDRERDLDVVMEVLRATFGLADARPAAARVQSTPPPVRAFVGTHDLTCPLSMAEELATELHGDVHTVTGIGHLPMLEDPVGTAAHIRTFHAEIERPRV